MQQLFQDKYKPRTINDFGFNNKFNEQFEMFVKQDILDILFIGHSGCGKSSFLDYVTSTYSQGMSKTEKDDNILVINQMKDTSVQYFRQNMKIFCQSYCSIFNKKKLIIIDDIDNINEHCQQILRSYMDNYHKNVFFIFTCTTSNKVISSIQSRLQIIKLPSISNNHLRVITENICKEENIVILPKAMEILFQLSNLSLRRLYGFLQLFYLCDTTIDDFNIFTICNCIPFKAIEKYFDHINKGELKKAIIQLYRYIDNGYSCIDIYEHILIYLKQSNQLCDNFKYFVVQKLANYMCIFYEFHEDPVELALFSNTLYCYKYAMYIQ